MMRKTFTFLIFFLVWYTVFAHVPAPTAAYHFIQNKGQWPQPVLYCTELPQGWLFLEKDGFTYNFLETAYFNPEKAGSEPAKTPVTFKGHAFGVKFLGANPESIITPQNQQSGSRNYFIGNDARRWATGVNAFGTIQYRQIFPGIDLQVHTTGDKLKYDYILAPQADAGAIRMKYEGIEQLSLQDGKLLIQTSVNEFLEEAPYAYQEINGEKQSVACAFTLQYNTVGFKITGSYNPELPLIIDPELIFATYSGSVSSVSSNCATADAAGNTYTGVHLLEPGYPTTTGAYQTTRRGFNMAISKFNEQGTALVFSTYLGGSNEDYPLVLAYNDQDEIVILGTSNSRNFPTFATSYERELNNGGNSGLLDYVLAKLSGTGDKLLASTYLGGSLAEGTYYSILPAGLTYDNSGNIYVGLNTQSSNFPIVNGFQPRIAGNYDGAVVKLNNSLSQIIWSSFLGGTDNDIISDIKVGASGQVYVCGATYSRNFPATAGVLSQTLSGIKDGFIAVIAPTGDRLTASSYFGTNQNDLVQLLKLDSDENIYAIGFTSGRYPVTSGAYTTPNTSGGYFIHKVNAALTTTAFSTHIGNSGSNDEFVPTAFNVDDCGYIYFSAYAVTDCPITPDAYEQTRKTLYFCQLARNADTLLYGSYFGSTGFGHIHYANKSIITETGYLHHIECTTSGNSPVTAGAYSDKRSGINSNDAALVRFQLANALSTRTQALTDVPAFSCAPATISFTNRSTNAVNYTWNFGDGSTESNEANPQHTYQNAGTYTVTLRAANADSCIPEDTIAIEVQVGARFAIPNIITPNNDGKNDAFVIQNILPGTHLKLYNRWGQLVYESSDYKNDWQAEQVTKGIYYYSVENPEACPPTLKGWLEVVE